MINKKGVQEVQQLDIRPIQAQDFPACALFYIDVFNRPPWNESWSFDSVLQRLTECSLTPGFFGLTAKVDGSIVGFVLGNIERWNEERHFHLKEMCVAVDWQRKGVGATLMQRVESELNDQGVAKIYLLTARDSVAQAFYQQCGFYASPKMIMMSKWIQR